MATTKSLETLGDEKGRRMVAWAVWLERCSRTVVSLPDLAADRCRSLLEVYLPVLLRYYRVLQLETTFSKSSVNWTAHFSCIPAQEKRFAKMVDRVAQAGLCTPSRGSCWLAASPRGNLAKWLTRNYGGQSSPPCNLQVFVFCTPYYGVLRMTPYTELLLTLRLLPARSPQHSSSMSPGNTKLPSKERPWEN